MSEEDRPAFTDAQVARQINKCREAIFDNYVELSDTEYRGDVCEAVKAILSKCVIVDRLLSEEEFQVMFSTTVTEITSWLLENTRGVDKMVCTFFSADFVGQTLGSSYAVQEVDTPDSDPMFG